MRKDTIGRSLVAALLLVTACGGSDAAQPARPASPARAQEGHAHPHAGEEPAPLPGSNVPERIVHLDLVTTSPRLRAGGTVQLAAVLDIEPGFHIYWTNPGETGLPTEATFHAPAGYESSEASFPAPRRYETEGGVVSYGYQDRTALFSTLTVPDDIAADESIRVRVDAHWMACREVCVPEQASATLELSAAKDSPAVHGELLEPYRSRLPKPLSELAEARAGWLDGALVVHVPGATTLDYFPGAAKPTLLGRTAHTAPPGLTLRFADAAPGARVRGVLQVRRQSRTEFYSLDVGGPAAGG